MAMIPLTVRSHYSLMWGTSSVQDLCGAARKMGYSRLAMTDTDNLYGLWPFLAACRRKGIKPIIGAELTDPETLLRAVCLVENDDGYRNLCRLLTCRHMGENYVANSHPSPLPVGEEPEAKRKLYRLKPCSIPAHFSLKDMLPKFSKGIIVLTRNPELLKPWYEAGVNVFAAMPRTPLHREHPLIKTAKYLGITPVATPGSFFPYPENHMVHRYLRAIDKNTSLSRLSSGEVAPKNAWLASPEEYERRFCICPEAIRQTLVLSERLNFTGPDFGLVMPPWESRNGKNAGRTLRDLTYDGAGIRYGGELSEPVVDRIEHELKIILRQSIVIVSTLDIQHAGYLVIEFDRHTDLAGRIAAQPPASGIRTGVRHKLRFAGTQQASQDAGCRVDCRQVHFTSD